MIASRLWLRFERRQIQIEDKNLAILSNVLQSGLLALAMNEKWLVLVSLLQLWPPTLPE